MIFMAVVTLWVTQTHIDGLCSRRSWYDQAARFLCLSHHVSFIICASRDVFICIQTDVTSQTLQEPKRFRVFSSVICLFAVNSHTFRPGFVHTLVCCWCFVQHHLIAACDCSIAHSCITLSHWHTMPRARFTLRLIRTPVSSNPRAVFLGRSWERLWPVGVGFSFLFHSYLSS